ISHYTDDQCGPTACKIDWNAVANQKVSLVYVKTSQGTSLDPDFKTYWKSLAKQQNIARGAFHFMSSTTDPKVAANDFVSKIKDAGGFLTRDLPPALDLEWDSYPSTDTKDDRWRNHAPDQIIDKVLAWLDVVKKKTGRTPVIYTSSVWW